MSHYLSRLKCGKHAGEEWGGQVCYTMPSVFARDSDFRSFLWCNLNLPKYEREIVEFHTFLFSCTSVSRGWKFPNFMPK